mgnify:FL=1|jgi:hypothetical protein|tara:strand:- start:198 stop:1547 length:1350 start_codon:yes stop_codon:yes gene_type:complete
MRIVFDNIEDCFNGKKDWKGNRTCASPYFIHLSVQKNFSTPILKPEMMPAGTKPNNILFTLNDAYRIEHYSSRDADITGFNYIYPIGVHGAPEHWMNVNEESIFSGIDNKHLDKARKGEALLVIDNSLEGYHDANLFSFFNRECSSRSIPVENVVFITGNLNVHELKEDYERENNLKTITVIGYSHFEYDIYEESVKTEIVAPTWEEQFKYKTENLENIKTFNFLNRRPRDHRIWMYTNLHKHNLLKDSIVSMNKFTVGMDSPRRMGIETLSTKDQMEAAATLPVFYDDVPTYGTDESIPGTVFINRLNEQPMLDSWITVVSEAQFEDADKAAFLSEKVFKPIACSSPFIILGAKNSLKLLRDKHGYQTFDALIPEGYDTLNDVDRVNYITEHLKHFSSISNKEKLEWFKHMRGVIEYNKMIFEYNSRLKPPVFFHYFMEFCKSTITLN